MANGTEIRSLLFALQHMNAKQDYETFSAVVTRELREGRHSLAVVKEYIKSLSQEERDLLLTRSAERSTHYKWCLASSSHRGMRIWLHTYKEWAIGENAFAASIHNHRYSFVSSILQGTLHEQRWLPTGNSTISPASETRYEAGDIYSISSGEIHSIEHADPSAITLVVQGPAVSSTTNVFNRNTLKLERQTSDLEGILSSLVGDE
jgi:predicted metal-dependent enzyme (double-stranded beta helix superfamily)